MSTVLGIDTAIGWAHWRLRGGWKNTLTTTAGYVGLIVLVLMLSLRADPNHVSNVLLGWKLALVWIQAGILVLFGGSRVAGAIRSDLTNRMIESHRLMPIPPLTAVSGYLWGPPSQALALAVATFFMGLILTIQAGINPAAWIGPNITLATFALFAWIVAGFGASIAKGVPGALIAVIMTVSTTRGAVLVIMPAAVLLTSPMIGKTVFSTSMTNAELSWPLMISMLGQAWIGSVLYIGIARKYRRSEDTALAVVPALLLLAGWSAASGIVLEYWDNFRPEYFRMDINVETPMLLAAMVSAMLIAPVAIANAARDRRWAPYSPLVALLAAAIVMFVPLMILEYSEHDPGYTIGVTAGAVGAFAIGLCFVLRIVYRITKRGWPLAFVWLLVSWIAPHIADVLRWMLDSANHDDMELSWISTMSPGGALILAWGKSKANAVPGVAFQCALAAAWALVFYLTRRRPKQIEAI